MMSNKKLARRGIQSPFFAYATARTLDPAKCQIRPHAVKDNGTEVVVSSFLDWQSRTYTSEVRAEANREAPPNLNIMPTDDDSTPEDEEVSADSGNDGQDEIAEDSSADVDAAEE